MNHCELQLFCLTARFFCPNQDACVSATLIQGPFSLDYTAASDNDYIGAQNQLAAPDNFVTADEDDNDDGGVGSFVPHLAQPISMPMNSGLMYNTQQAAMQDVP